MRALLRDRPLIHDRNLIGVADRAQPMRDDDRRHLALIHNLVERSLHDLLALIVKSGRRLVEQKDLWLTHEGTRYRDALLCPPDSRPPRNPTSEP